MRSKNRLFRANSRFGVFEKHQNSLRSSDLLFYTGLDFSASRLIVKMEEAFKKQRLSSHEYYQAKRWEGKPFSYKFKYMVANFPEVALLAGACMITPLFMYLTWLRYPGSKREALLKYKPTYTVVRDDDPNLELIIKQKESGREFFPE